MNPPASTETAITRSRDVWPRFTDWLDTLVPSDLNWRTGFPHSIRVEEFTRDGSLVIRAEMPGIDPDEDVHIHVKDSMLTIEGKREEHTETDQRSEFFYGTFMRTLRLPSETKSEDIKAEYRDGILEIAIPVREPTTPAESIPISHN